MSQTLGDRLSIDQIARRWARETDNAGFGAEDIADDLVKAAELGEFEHTIYARANAPLGEYTYKEDWIDPKKSKTLKGEQPYVGPYRSALSMQDNRPVNSIDIVNYIKTRGTAPGATDRETRRIVARDIFLSVEGLRRWCEEPGFAEWAKLRGLSRPKFIDRAGGDGTGQASAVVQEPEEADAPSPSPPRKKAPKPRGRRGRKKGSGSFADKDAPVLELMKPLIAGGKSYWPAAMEVAPQAAGAGTVESKAKRLVARFKEWEKSTQFN